jgi:hypothetical protein
MRSKLLFKYEIGGQPDKYPVVIPDGIVGFCRMNPYDITRNTQFQPI